MKPTLASFALVLLSVWIVSCGGTSKSSTNAAATASTATTTSSSTTGGHSKTVDEDENPELMLNYGSAASPALAHTIIATVKRYYALSAADNGAAACAMINPVMRKAIPEDYGQAPGPVATRGKTCAVVMTKFFRQPHQKIEANSKITITGVRVKGDQVFALLRFSTTPEQRYLPLLLESGVWKVDAVTDRELEP